MACIDIFLLTTLSYALSHLSSLKNKRKYYDEQSDVVKVYY